jgi:hypothetical protein
MDICCRTREVPLVRLGNELPFGRVTEHLEGIMGVVVHAETARRQILVAGQRVLAVQKEQAQRLAVCPQEKASERMVMNSDGAMVPLVGGVWAEVKLAAWGRASQAKWVDDVLHRPLPRGTSARAPAYQLFSQALSSDPGVSELFARSGDTEADTPEVRAHRGTVSLGTTHLFPSDAQASERHKK